MPGTVEQRDAALAEANRVRVKRAGWRQAMKAGVYAYDETIAVLRDPDFASMKVALFMDSFPLVGPRKVDEWLRLLGVAPTATIGRLTARQVALIEEFVRERYVRARLRVRGARL